MIATMSAFERRQRVLEVVEDYIEEHGWSPSYEDIMERAGIASKSTVHQYLYALEREGKIRLGGGPRMIAVYYQETMPE